MTLKTPWPICTTCRAISSDIFLSRVVEKPHLLWPKFSAFVKSAQGGCHSCTLLYEAVREPHRQRLYAEPIYLENAFIDGARIVVVTTDLSGLPDSVTWHLPFIKPKSEQKAHYEYYPLAHVRYVVDSKDVPQGASHFKGQSPSKQMSD